VSSGGLAVVGVQLIKLGVQTLQAIPVLTDRRLIQQRMNRSGVVSRCVQPERGHDVHRMGEAGRW
jgi:hypothetical protein